MDMFIFLKIIFVYCNQYSVFCKGQFVGDDFA